MPEWPKGVDCKSTGTAYGGSNPSRPTTSGCHVEGVSVELTDSSAHPLSGTANGPLRVQRAVAVTGVRLWRPSGRAGSVSWRVPAARSSSTCPGLPPDEDPRVGTAPLDSRTVRVRNEIVRFVAPDGQPARRWVLGEVGFVGRVERVVGVCRACVVYTHAAKLRRSSTCCGPAGQRSPIRPDAARRVVPVRWRIATSKE